MLNLPDDLRTAIAQALAAAPAPRWIHEAQAVSQRYRAPRVTPGQPLVSGDAPTLGYAALILPTTYAQIHGAIAATAARVPAWSPETMLDLGSGPGTALWAATARWPSLRVLSAWEREKAFTTFGRALARGSQVAAVRETRWRQVDLSRIGANESQQYDLVVLGHVLNELDAETRAAVTAAAWWMTSGLLLIVEPGTPVAFEIVRATRDQLLADGARTIAPCAHDRPCPLANDWCHFPQRLKRPDFQRRARGAPSEWEDTKFSYAALARFGPDSPIWGRVIREPTSNKAYAEAIISAQEGIVRHQALKRQRAAYRRVRDLVWGEALIEPPSEEGRS